MQYFITGATGFLGRQFVPLLLARGGDVAVLVRAASQDRFATLREFCGPPATGLRAVTGDVREPRLGIDADQTERLRGAQVFHLAGVYDLLADRAETERTNVQGTQNMVTFANDIGAACFHHMSSIAVAGRHRGRFTEEMFDAGQALDHPYYRTKFEAERIVRERLRVPFRVYRPGMVIGSSQTGEADRVDGPYYAFKFIQGLRDSFPSWMPFIGPEGGPLNLVPVDFVVRALDHIAHRPGLDGRAFHLVDPAPLSVGDTLNTFCRAAHAPEFALRLDRRMLNALPAGVAMAGQLPAIQRARKQVLARYGIPDAALTYMDHAATFDAAATTEALRGSGITCPSLHSYAWRVWDFWERRLDPELPTARNVRSALEGKVVLITGASSGIGAAVAQAIAASGCTIIAVARGAAKLEATRAAVEAQGGRCTVYPADLSDPGTCQEMVARVIDEHGRVDVLINSAGRSIRRAVTASVTRFHDFDRTMAINYFGAVACILAVLPGMKKRGDGHILNISSIGVQTFPPRFAAYVASKAALDAFSQCLAPEITADGVAITTIHMPLVRTPMIAPTSIYRSFPTISPDEAAEMVVKALISRPHEVSTRIGKVGQVVAAVAPGLHQLIMTAAFAALPDSAKRRDGGDSAALDDITPEGYALTQLMRGIHL